jgi:hypothetical protein
MAEHWQIRELIRRITQRLKKRSHFLAIEPLSMFDCDHKTPKSGTFGY